MGLTSVSMPDQGLDLKELLDPDEDSLLSNWYRVDADQIYTRTDQFTMMISFEKNPPL